MMDGQISQIFLSWPQPALILICIEMVGIQQPLHSQQLLPLDMQPCLRHQYTEYVRLWLPTGCFFVFPAHDILVAL